MAENRRQYDTSMAENQRQFDLNYNESVRQYDQNFAESQRQFNLGYEQDESQFARSLAQQASLAQLEREYNATQAQLNRDFQARQNELDRQNKITVAGMSGSSGSGSNYNVQPTVTTKTNNFAGTLMDEAEFARRNKQSGGVKVNGTKVTTYDQYVYEQLDDYATKQKLTDGEMLQLEMEYASFLKNV